MLGDRIPLAHHGHAAEIAFHSGVGDTVDSSVTAQCILIPRKISGEQRLRKCKLRKMN